MAEQEEDTLNPDIIEDVDPPPTDDDDGGNDDAALEERARKLGWRPESEWDERRAQREGRRKPPRFLSAKEFLARGEEEVPILRANQKRLESELERLKASVTEQNAFIKEQQTFHMQALERARADERAKIKNEAKVAAAEGDVEAHDAAMKKLDAFDEQQRQAIVQEAKKVEAVREPQQQQTQPDVDAWVRENPWFTDENNSHLNATMIAEYNRITRANPNQSKREQLESAKRKVMQRFPEAFGIDPSPMTGSAVETPTNRRAGDSPEARFARLPAAERAVYHKHKERFKAMGTDYTIKEFLDSGAY